MDLLAALDIIRNTSDDSLHVYATQTISTLKEIGNRLRHNLLPSPLDVNTPSSFEPNFEPDNPNDSIARRSSPDSCARSQASSRETGSHSSHQLDTPEPLQQQCLAANPLISAEPVDKSASMRVSSLVKGIRKTASWLSAAKALEFQSIVSLKRSLEDCRLEDIRRVEGDKNIDGESKLRRVLALRSIALQHNDQQIEREVPQTRLAELYAKALCTKGSHDKKGKQVEKQFNLKALSNGLKHLVFEQLWNDCLKARGLPGDYCAISFVVGLNIANFQKLHYWDMLAAVNTAWDIEIPLTQKGDAQTVPLFSLVHDLAGWLQHLQSLYNVKFSGLSEPHSVRQNRRRLDPDPVEGSNESHENISTNEPSEAPRFTPNPLRIPDSTHPPPSDERPSSSRGPVRFHVDIPDPSEHAAFFPDPARSFDEIIAQQPFDLSEVNTASENQIINTTSLRLDHTRNPAGCFDEIFARQPFDYQRMDTESRNQTISLSSPRLDDIRIPTGVFDEILSQQPFDPHRSNPELGNQPFNTSSLRLDDIRLHTGPFDKMFS